MKPISPSDLITVTGAGLSSRGTPIPGTIGCYMQYKKFNGKLFHKDSCTQNGWVRDHSVFPDYDGDSSAGAPQG